MLQLLQGKRESGHWLPARALTEVAGGFGLPRGKVEGVAGFYAFLRPSPSAGRRAKTSSPAPRRRFTHAVTLPDATGTVVDVARRGAS